MRLSTIFVSSALMFAGLSAALPMTEENMLAARSESDSLAELDARAFEEELDLFARGNAFSKGSGGDKERSDGNPPKYKVAKKDPPPRYDGPPSPIHFESPGTNYANNHKSPATGAGRGRRSFDEEDELFARKFTVVKTNGIKGFGGNHHRRALNGEGELCARKSAGFANTMGVKGIVGNFHHRRALDGEDEIFARSRSTSNMDTGFVKNTGGNHHRRALDEEAELSARYNPAMGNGGSIKTSIKVFGGNHHRRALDEEAELSARKFTGFVNANGIKGTGGIRYRRALDEEAELFARKYTGFVNANGVKGTGGIRHRRALDDEAELSARYNQAMGNGRQIRPGIKVLGGGHHL